MIYSSCFVAQKRIMKLKNIFIQNKKQADKTTKMARKISNSFKTQEEKIEFENLILKINQLNNIERFEMIGFIAHEIKNPLSTIMGFSDLMSKTDNDKLYKEYAAHIYSNTNELLKKLTDMIEISKSGYKDLKINNKHFDTKKTTENVISDMKPSIKAKNILVITSLDEDICLVADVTKFKQVLFNLISNAIKNTPSNGRIEIKNYIKNEMFYTVITNSGKRIKKINKSKLFNFFTKMKDSLPAGSGLGLAICKNIVKAQNGDIKIDYKYKKGTSIWFSIPIKNSNKS